MDGWVTIGTKLDSKQLEKDLKNEYKKLEQFEKEAERLSQRREKAEVDLQPYVEEKTLIEQIHQESLKLAQTEGQRSAETENYNVQMNQLKEKYAAQLHNLEDIDNAIQENTYHQGLTNNEIDELNSKLKQTKGFSSIKEQIDSIGNSIQKVTKKIAKWAIAIFGIRSAYMAIRSAINTISGDDEQLKADIEYMKNAIAYTLEPIVRSIVNLAKQLLFYIGYIIKAWTGKNIFENANKNLNKATGSAKELKKTLSGFDEMNIVGDNSSSGGGGGATPSFNLSNLNDGDVPKWLKFIVRNKKGILSVLGGIVTSLTLIKFGVKGIKALGIGIAVTGILLTIQKIIDFIKDPSFDNFIGILKGIALAVTGVAIAIEAWPVALAGAIALVVLLIVKHFDEIKEWFNNLLKWMETHFLGKLRELFGPIGDIIYGPFEITAKTIKSLFENLFGGVKRFVEGIVKLFNGDFKGGISDIFGGILDIMLSPFRTARDMIMAIIDAIKRAWDSFFDWFAQKDAWFNNKASGEGYGGGFSSGGGHGGGGGSSHGFAKGGIIYSKLPKLASGGIINQPGRGVPLASAIGGERSMEGVIPLTDSQMMSLLGKTIGEYITINANITNTMNGRVISRELQKVQNDSDFAFNR